MKFSHLMHQGGQWAATVLWKKDSEAPDYTPVANASVEAAQIADRLGRDQMTQARQLHDETMALARPVIDAQIRLSDQQIRQGDDYYNYMVSRQRPVEDALNREAMNYDGTQDAAERQAIMARINSNAAMDERERALITGGDTVIYNERQADIEESVGRAIADARSGQASSTNQMIRQAARYGFSPERMAALAGQNGLAQASQQAAAANGTRQAGIERARALMAQGYDMRNATNNNVVSGMMNDRNMRLSDNAREWARKLDVAGLYRGMPGASQAAYGMAGQLGSSAIQNQMAPGAAMMSQNQGAMGTIMQGQGLKVQGMSNVLNAQTNFANSQSSQGSPLAGIAGMALGGWAGGGFQNPFGK